MLQSAAAQGALRSIFDFVIPYSMSVQMFWSIFLSVSDPLFLRFQASDDIKL